jgi:hypothetical protein
MPGAGAGPDGALIEGAADMRAPPRLEKRFPERHHPMRMTTFPAFRPLST